jgi:hypothetical protein
MPEYIVNDTQALLAVDTVKGGKRYFRESEFFGKNLTAQDVISEVGDTAIRIYRTGVDPMTGILEDITERVAKAYLEIADNDEFGVEAHKLPAYVLQSRAWEIWQDGDESPAPLAFGASAATQGLVQGATL